MDSDRNWIESLLFAIESKPMLYDKGVKDYSNKHAKARAWAEVCEMVVPDWLSLTTENKQMKGEFLFVLSCG